MKNKKIFLIISSFLISFLLIFLLGKLVFKSINTTFVNYAFIVAFFIFGFFIFEFLDKKLEFDFSEIYVGVILLIILYLGFWFAFLIYYGTISMSYLMNYLFKSPYIYISLSFFLGWCTYSLIKKVK